MSLMSMTAEENGCDAESSAVAHLVRRIRHASGRPHHAAAIARYNRATRYGTGSGPNTQQRLNRWGVVEQG